MGDQIQVVTRDDPEYMMFKARVEGVTMFSKGSRLLGGFYGAAGESRRPTAILLHGMPGIEKDLDFAYSMRDSGWNVLYFHYRGCWGSEGNYSLNGLQDDVKEATEWTVKQPSVDVERLVLIGCSMGGYLTLSTGAGDGRFKALVSVCPPIDPAQFSLPLETWREYAAMLHGISAEQLRTQMGMLPSVLSFAEGLRERKILMITADEDAFFRPEHYQSFSELMPHVKWFRFASADHSFCAYRKQLIEKVMNWLSEERI